MTVQNDTARVHGLSNQQATARSPARRLSGQPAGPGTFALVSRTIPDRRYLCTVTPERIYCTCDGYAYRSSCWHVIAVTAVLRQEASALLQERAARRLDEIAEEFGL
jgi:SWIM zinc finger